MIKKEKPQSQVGWKTTKRERMNYFIGEIGRVCEANVFVMFMSTFLIFQGIDLAAVAGVMLAVKIIDAVDDVVFGYLVDKWKITEWKVFNKITGEGKYLPWYRLTFFLFPVFTIIFFLMPTNLSENGKLVWFTVFYLLYDISYTLVEVPMNSLMVTLTDNLDERNSIIQTKTILGGAIVLPVSIIWLALVSEYVGIPIKIVAIASSIIFLVMMLPLTKGVHEHNTKLANVDEQEAEHYSLKDMFNVVKTNKYLLILLLSNVLINGLATGSAVGLFTSYYLLGSSMVLVIPIAISFIPVIIAQSQTAKLTRKFGKLQVIIGGGLVGGLIYGMIYFGGPNIILVSTLLVLQALPSNISLVAKGFILPDTIEYARYKTGKDCSGISFALNSFVTKLTASLSASLGLFILGLSNWVNIQATDFADLAAQGIEQPESALNVLWLVYMLVPAIGTILGVLVMFFYNLKDQDVELMTKCNAGEISREECESQLSRHYGQGGRK